MKKYKDPVIFDYFLYALTLSIILQPWPRPTWTFINKKITICMILSKFLTNTSENTHIMQPYHTHNNCEHDRYLRYSLLTQVVNFPYYGFQKNQNRGLPEFAWYLDRFAMPYKTDESSLTGGIWRVYQFVSCVHVRFYIYPLAHKSRRLCLTIIVNNNEASDCRVSCLVMQMKIKLMGISQTAEPHHGWMANLAHVLRQMYLGYRANCCTVCHSSHWYIGLPGVTGIIYVYIYDLIGQTKSWKYVCGSTIQIIAFRYSYIICSYSATSYVRVESVPYECEVAIPNEFRVIRNLSLKFYSMKRIRLVLGTLPSIANHNFGWCLIANNNDTNLYGRESDFKI